MCTEERRALGSHSEVMPLCGSTLSFQVDCIVLISVSGSFNEKISEIIRRLQVDCIKRMMVCSISQIMFRDVVIVI